MKRFSSYNYKWLFALIPALCMQACVKEEAINSHTTNNGEVEVRFEVQLPANPGNRPTTRGMSEAEETTVATIDVYHFLEDGSGKYRGVKSEPIQGTFTPGPPSWVNATLETRPNKNSRLVIVANARKAGNYGYTKQIELDDFLSKLVFEQTAEWNSAAGAATPLPMYCITGDVEIKKDIQNGELDNNGNPFGLIRMHAKFNISQQALVNNFKLASVCVFNRKTEGYIAYKESDLDTSTPANPKVTAPHVPATTGNVYEPTLPYFGVGTNNQKPDYEKIVNKQYLFEVDNAAQSDRLKKTALVIGGYYSTDGGTTYDAIPSYYRVDIDVTNGNILRNHLYDVEIKSVAGRGYGTAKDAFEGGSRMTAKITAWNEAAQNAIGDGQYYLTVDRRAYHFYKEGGALPVTITTDYSRTDEGFDTGIQIDANKIIYNPAVSGGNEWITIEDVTGQNGDLTREIKIKPAANNDPSAANRSAKVPIHARNMTYYVNITQEKDSWLTTDIESLYSLDGNTHSFNAFSTFDWSVEIKAGTNNDGALVNLLTSNGSGIAGVPVDFDTHFLGINGKNKFEVILTFNNNDNIQAPINVAVNLCATCGMRGIPVGVPLGTNGYDNSTTDPNSIGEKTYLTHMYGNKCWMIQNSREGTADATRYSGKVAGSRGYYYTFANATKTSDGPCPSGWRVPTVADVQDLQTVLSANINLPEVKFWGGPSPESYVLGGYYYLYDTSQYWELWDVTGIWWTTSTSNSDRSFTSHATLGVKTGGSQPTHYIPVRCVKE
ncbi:FISUMP domain-containing protein [Bacteroides sp. 224]|uniref:FISUMP domain-containing protein n=1 Tax=Bacteroides sp. 224 TaxID=2302936 RepID=UPI0013D523BB|nr:FISUMP domain-containing protein [Bacteroides sp. 224]NDV67126.1 hypothetical protein [Bacteroides sp. 224]